MIKVGSSYIRKFQFFEVVSGIKPPIDEHISSSPSNSEDESIENKEKEKPENTEEDYSINIKSYSMIKIYNSNTSHKSSNNENSSDLGKINLKNYLNTVNNDKDTLFAVPGRKTDAYYPDTVTRIGAYAFAYNKTPNIIESLPHRITIVGEHAFIYSNLSARFLIYNWESNITLGTN